MAEKKSSTKSSSLQASDFVHLHNHTQYSLLDGLTKIPKLIGAVKDFGMEAVAVTDHGTLSGLIEFYKTAAQEHVKPVFGMETYIAARKHTDKDAGLDKANYHLILLAINNTGYQNLMKLSTIANLDGFYYRPRIDHDLLEKYNEGLIVLSGCIGGELGEHIRQDQTEKAMQIAKWYKKVFGDRYYIELQDHGHPDHPSRWAEQTKANEALIKIADELNVPCVVTADAHYLKKEDQEAHEILLCVQTGSFLSDEKRMSLKDFQLHVEDPQEIIKRWGKDYPEFIKNTRAIADRCDITIELGKILIPKFPVPKGKTEKTYLQQLVYQGLAWRYADASEKKAAKLSFSEAKKMLPKNIQDRAAYEFDVIDTMGFNGYFLIIADFINWGKNRGIVFGPGRGSAAGSIIAYAMKITELDPLKYDLLFERFLNPDRISMPDIDIDIQDSRRNEVIEYCVEKYGSDRVANIVTFGTMAARNAVRDVARVLQVPYAEADRLAKMIPPPVQGRHVPLEKSLIDDQDLKREYAENEQAKRVFDLAIRLEGTIRSHGVHAAGVVIAPDDIVKFVPLEMAQKGVVATQYSMNPVEDLGLLKMDFLGLSNLTIIKNALRIIKRVYDEDIDINTIPLDDKETYELLSRGDTTGVFQFESAGMKRYLRELKPTVFEDIVAMGALYRPGPLTAGLTDKFIARKNGHEKVTYDHRLMENALKTTYGVLVYQEQVMRIAQDMCGFSGGEADTLRKAVGKKIREMMIKMKDKIIKGAIKNGVDEHVAEKFWKDLEGFADYAFNKSHAACYALISYQTAYLKAHYPAAFMAALMTSDYDDTDRLAIEMTECNHMGIEVLPPSVNESFVEFAVVLPSNKDSDESGLDGAQGAAEEQTEAYKKYGKGAPEAATKGAAKSSSRVGGSATNQATMASSARIRFGMAAIKNVGTGAVEEILQARQDGEFTSIEDFLTKVSPRVVNRKTLESLIKSGAFDAFNERGTLLANIDLLSAFAAKLNKQKNSGQVDLFGEAAGTVKAELDLQEGQEIPLREQLQWERELLGLYLSQHPLDSYKTILAEKAAPLKLVSKDYDNRTISSGGMVSDVREISTKNGQKMAFVKITDEHNECELVLFPSVYQETLGIWERDNVVLFTGKISCQDKNGQNTEEPKVLVSEAREVTLDQAMAYQATGKKPRLPRTSGKPAAKPASSDVPKRLFVRVEDSSDQKLLGGIKEVVDQNAGSTEVVLVVGPDKSKQAIKLPINVKNDDHTLSQLKELVGQANVKVQ